MLAPPRKEDRDSCDSNFEELIFFFLSFGHVHYAILMPKTPKGVLTFLGHACLTAHLTSGSEASYWLNLWWCFSPGFCFSSAFSKHSRNLQDKHLLRST